MIHLRYSTGSFASAIFNFKSFTNCGSKSIVCMFSLPTDQENTRRFNTDLTCYKSGSKMSSFIALSIGDNNKKLGIYSEYIYIYKAPHNAFKQTWKHYTKNSHNADDELIFKFAQEEEKYVDYNIFKLSKFGCRNVINATKEQYFKLLGVGNKVDTIVGDTSINLDNSNNKNLRISKSINVTEQTHDLYDTASSSILFVCSPIDDVKLSDSKSLDSIDSRQGTIIKGNADIFNLVKKTYGSSDGSDTIKFTSGAIRRFKIYDIDIRYSKKQNLRNDVHFGFAGDRAKESTKKELNKFLNKDNEPLGFKDTTLFTSTRKKGATIKTINKWLVLIPKLIMKPNTYKKLRLVDKETGTKDTFMFGEYITDKMYINGLGLNIAEVDHNINKTPVSKFLDLRCKNINKSSMVKWLLSEDEEVRIGNSSLFINSYNEYINSIGDMKSFEVANNSICINDNIKSFEVNNDSLSINDNTKSVYTRDKVANYSDMVFAGFDILGGSPDDILQLSTLNNSASIIDSVKFADTDMNTISKFDLPISLKNKNNTINFQSELILVDKSHGNKINLSDNITVINSNSNVRFIEGYKWFAKSNNGISITNFDNGAKKKYDIANKSTKFYLLSSKSDGLALYKGYMTSKVDNEAPSFNEIIFANTHQNGISIVDTLKTAYRSQNRLAVYNSDMLLNRDATYLGMFDSNTLVESLNTDLSILSGQKTLVNKFNTINVYESYTGLSKGNNSLLMSNNILLENNSYNTKVNSSLFVSERSDVVSMPILSDFVDRNNYNIRTYDLNKFLERNNYGLGMYDSNRFTSRQNSSLNKFDFENLLERNNQSTNYLGDNLLCSNEMYGTNILDADKMLYKSNVGMTVNNRSDLLYRENTKMHINDNSNLLHRENTYLSVNEFNKLLYSSSCGISVLNQSNNVYASNNSLFRYDYDSLLSNGGTNASVNNFGDMLENKNNQLYKSNTGCTVKSSNNKAYVFNSQEFVFSNNNGLVVNEFNKFATSKNNGIYTSDFKFATSNNSNISVGNFDVTATRNNEYVTLNEEYKMLYNTGNRANMLKQLSITIGSSSIILDDINLGLTRCNSNLSTLNGLSAIRNNSNLLKYDSSLYLKNKNSGATMNNSKLAHRYSEYISIFDNESVISYGNELELGEDIKSAVNGDNSLVLNMSDIVSKGNSDGITENNSYLLGKADNNAFTAIGNKFMERQRYNGSINNSSFAYKEYQDVRIHKDKDMVFKDATNINQEENISLVNNGNSLGYSSFVFAESNNNQINIFDTATRINGYAKYILKQDISKSVSKSKNKVKTISSSLLLGFGGKEVNINSSISVCNYNNNVFMNDDLKVLDSKNIGITMNNSTSVGSGNNRVIIGSQNSVSKDGNVIYVENGSNFVTGGNSTATINKSNFVEYVNANLIMDYEPKSVASGGKNAFTDTSKFVSSDAYYTSIDKNLFVNYSNANAIIDKSLFVVNYSKDIMLDENNKMVGDHLKNSVVNNSTFVSKDGNTASIDSNISLGEGNKYVDVLDTNLLVGKQGSLLRLYNGETSLSVPQKYTYISESDKSITNYGKTVSVMDGYLWYTNNGKYTDIDETQRWMSNDGKRVFKDTVLNSLNFKGKAVGIFNTNTLISNGNNTLFSLDQHKWLYTKSSNARLSNYQTSVDKYETPTDILDDDVLIDSKVTVIGDLAKMNYYGMTKDAKAHLYQTDMFGYVKDFLPPIDILEDTKDELLLPREQFDYTQYESKVFGENMSVHRKHLKGYTDNGEPIINIPIENPVTYYADIAKDYIDVDVKVMRKVLELLYNNWRKNIHRYAGVEATKAINNILESTHEELKEWYTSTTDPLRVKHAERSLKLFAWYSEMAILTYADYHVTYERADAVFDFWDKLPTYSINPNDVVKGIQEDEILTFENFTYDSKPYILTSNPGVEATIKLRNMPQSCETYLSFSAFLIGKGIITVTTDDEIYTFDTRRNAINIPLPANNNEVEIRFSPLQDGAFVDISQFKIKNRYNTSYDLEYTGKVSNVNFTIQYILDVMTIAGDSVEEVQPVFKTTAPLAYALDKFKEYMETHHDKKYKGKRLTARK